MPKAIILRLESYLTYLAQLAGEGKTTATSEELARLFGISSSRVRQDLLGLKAAGRPRSGYDIAELEGLIIQALDVHNVKGIALVGFGNLGRALAGSEVWGQASVTVCVKVACFSKSVSLSVERRFAGSDGDPTFAQTSTSDDWGAYLEAFAM